ncbi:hypothetical protein [Vagococcus intermedius]|uniref:Uncharacterized protein n=1 Tax=Vagococcus intermedius TaxID=2991418 RepID=A0AAF0I4A3_9ENTE|nr:hypothetical protein [Vagococcus intermedius]WEG72388.1 hypothetical protein OL234_05230 [Vagococcus intermedius]WEG74476.1 hypothetical protein OL235_05235 [Vagococcus intermedius]
MMNKLLGIQNDPLKKIISLRLDFFEDYLAKQIPSGFKVVVEHNDDLQPLSTILTVKTIGGNFFKTIKISLF